MTTEQYNELMQELNFSDSSVGIMPIYINDTLIIEDILKEFNYIPIGKYKNKNSYGFKFKDDKGVYAIQEDIDGLNVYKIIDL